MAHLRNPELFAAVLAAPDDVRPRLVYADWWSDRSDPRGELTVLQCELEKIEPQDDDGSRHLLRCASADLAGSVAGVRHGFRRGFVEALSIDAKDLVGRIDAILEAEPVRDLRLRKFDPKSTERLFSNPLLTRFRSLAFSAPVPDYVIAQLGRSQHLSRLQLLDLSTSKIGPKAVDLLMQMEKIMPALEVLALGEAERIPGYSLEHLARRWGDRLQANPRLDNDGSE